MTFVLCRHTLDVSVCLLGSEQNLAILHGNPPVLNTDRESKGDVKADRCFYQVTVSEISLWCK